MADTQQFNPDKSGAAPSDPTNPIRGLQEAKRAGSRSKVSPEAWNPPFCGDIDMRIARDGTWYYLNSPIGRKPLVQLFASVMRREADGRYYLVTPVEKCGITVDDAPFLAVAMTINGSGRGQEIVFTTNLDEVVTVDRDHPLRFEIEDKSQGLKPYVLIRGRLEALVARAVFYDLVAAGHLETRDDGTWFGVWSSGQFWPMAPGNDLEFGAQSASD